MNCRDCKHWNRRGGLHEVFERANFGECSVITPGYIIDPVTHHLNIEEAVALGAWIEGRCYPTLVVHADFGCVRFAEKKRIRVGRRKGEKHEESQAG